MIKPAGGSWQSASFCRNHLILLTKSHFQGLKIRRMLFSEYSAPESFTLKLDFQLKVRQPIRNRIHSSQLRFNLDYFSAFIWLSFLIVSLNGFSLWNNLVINKQKQLIITKQIQVSLNLFERLRPLTLVTRFVSRLMENVNALNKDAKYAFLKEKLHCVGIIFWSFLLAVWEHKNRNKLSHALTSSGTDPRSEATRMRRSGQVWYFFRFRVYIALSQDMSSRKLISSNQIG